MNWTLYEDYWLYIEILVKCILQVLRCSTNYCIIDRLKKRPEDQQSVFNLNLQQKRVFIRQIWHNRRHVLPLGWCNSSSILLRWLQWFHFQKIFIKTIQAHIVSYRLTWDRSTLSFITLECGCWRGFPLEEPIRYYKRRRCNGRAGWETDNIIVYP